MPPTAFVVPGVPAPKGSRISGRRKDGSIFTRPASKGEHVWVEAVAKLVRAVLDGLTRGGVIVDDRHVTDLSAAKFWAEPGDEGVAVSVESVPG
jgi:hypothetical protein